MMKQGAYTIPLLKRYGVNWVGNCLAGELAALSHCHRRNARISERNGDGIFANIGTPAGN
jgi:hypothetical protein